MLCRKSKSALDLVAEFKSRAFPHQGSYEAVEELAGQLDELRTLLIKDGSQQTLGLRRRPDLRSIGPSRRYREFRER